MAQKLTRSSSLLVPPFLPGSLGGGGLLSLRLSLRRSRWAQVSEAPVTHLYAQHPVWTGPRPRGHGHTTPLQEGRSGRARAADGPGTRLHSSRGGGTQADGPRPRGSGHTTLPGATTGGEIRPSIGPRLAQSEHADSVTTPISPAIRGVLVLLTPSCLDRSRLLGAGGSAANFLPWLGSSRAAHMDIEGSGRAVTTPGRR